GRSEAKSGADLPRGRSRIARFALHPGDGLYAHHSPLFSHCSVGIGSPILNVKVCTFMWSALVSQRNEKRYHWPLLLKAPPVPLMVLPATFGIASALTIVRSGRKALSLL